MQHRSVLWTKGTLLASASVLAIAISVPQAIAADMPVKAPPMHTYAPAPVVNPWTWWVEGGAQGLVGDPYVPGFTPPFDAEPKSWGWSAAIGFDYRFNAAWHLSAAFRYGSNKTKTSTSTQNGLFGPGVPITTVTTGTVVGTGPNSASRKEYNWTADFAVGRDIGIGIGTSQVKVGVRVAQIRGKTDGSASWSVPSFFGGTTSSSSYHQTNKFTGAGPRIAIEGNAPISGPWSLDYMAGVAVLFGTRKVDQTAATTGTFPCISGCPLNVSSSNDGAVFNPDAMLGISYQLTHSTRISLNYRVDAYLDGMRGFDSGGNATNISRVYHGPNLRLTVTY